MSRSRTFIAKGNISKGSPVFISGNQEVSTASCYDLSHAKSVIGIVPRSYRDGQEVFYEDIVSYGPITNYFFNDKNEGGVVLYLGNGTVTPHRPEGNASILVMGVTTGGKDIWVRQQYLGRNL